ncbi:hypothetical protein PGB90_006603 [Kerria lacca]
MTRLMNEIKKGLGAETHNSATVKCYQTYIQDLPSGNETGQHIVLDLAGINFRVILVTLKKNSRYEEQIRTYSFPLEIINGQHEKFFDFIADCLNLFLEDLNLNTKNLGLGFCFGFTVELEGLTKAILVHWSKWFSLPSVVGKDVVALLKDACKKKGLNVHPILITNDTTDCLLSCLWTIPKCRMGVIIGRGTNACYLEKIENIGTFKGDPTKPYMIINTEWANFGNNGCLDHVRNDFDREVDQISKNPGIQIFEKMASALYLGELVRLTVLKAAKLKLLFEGETSEMLHRPMSFLPEFIYEIENDNTYELYRTLGILEVMQLNNASLQDCVNVKYICKVIVRRSAYLIAAAISAVVNKMGVTPIAIAFSGSLFKKHHKYKDLLHNKVKGMINPEIQTECMCLKNGIGKGTAMLMANYSIKHSHTQ